MGAPGQRLNSSPAITFHVGAGCDPRASPPSRFGRGRIHRKRPKESVTGGNGETRLCHFTGQAARLHTNFSPAIELGSITPAEPKSLYPSFILAEAWENGLIRYLWLASLFLNIGLFVWVSLIIPSFSSVGLGFNADGTVNAVPSLQLIIVPLTSTFLALTGFLTGLYYFRWEKTQMISFVLWASSAY